MLILIPHRKLYIFCLEKDLILKNPLKFYLASREYFDISRRTPAAAIPVAQINSLRCVNFERFAIFVFFHLHFLSFDNYELVISFLVIFLNTCTTLHNSDSDFQGSNKKLFESAQRLE